MNQRPFAFSLLWLTLVSFMTASCGEFFTEYEGHIHANSWWYHGATLLESGDGGEPSYLHWPVCKKGKCAHGFGSVTSDGGWHYKGGFSHGMFDGDGNYENDFFEYVGGFKGGNLHGHGVMTCEDGTRYEGVFDNGMMNGEFKVTVPGGVESTQWIRGVKIRATGLCGY